MIQELQVTAMTTNLEIQGKLSKIYITNAEHEFIS